MSSPHITFSCKTKDILLLSCVTLQLQIFLRVNNIKVCIKKSYIEVCIKKCFSLKHILSPNSVNSVSVFYLITNFVLLLIN